jgi:hypothetical protein
MKTLAIGVFVLASTTACGGRDVKLGTLDGDSGVSEDASAPHSSGGDASVASSDGGVCTPDPPGTVISGTNGGQADAPYCPWNGCLDGPKASCGTDHQWHCPPPPSECPGGGSGNTCTASGGTCVITHDPCPAGTAPDGNRPDQSGCNQEPGEICCRPSSLDAGSFACGNVTCAGGYCADRQPGVMTSDGGVPPDYYECDPLPSECLSTPTCACIVPRLGASCTVAGQNACKDDGAGHVTVVCQGV